MKAAQMTGKTFYLGKYRFNVNRFGFDISNQMRGIFLAHPFTKHFSFKQYGLIWTWLINGKESITNEVT